LEAEIIRDSALAVSGLLSPRLGGPSVYPYQPAGVLVNRATPAEWIESPDSDRHRRSLYTYYFRLTPHPYLPLFDVPDSLTACTRRQTTNTPLQALTLLNDPTFVECARALARHVVNHATDDPSRLCYAFGLALARSPGAEEQRLLLQLLDETRSALEGDPTAAQAIATSSPGEDPVLLAGWIEVCRALLNLDEFITRE
jgi:hypothetical protein